MKKAMIFAACALLAACASAPQPPRGPPPGRGAHRGPIPDGETEAALFISPMGQPFRSRPGEPYPSAAWFAAADKDGDGRLELDEFLADAQAFLTKLDTNGDGIVSSPENLAYERSIPEMLGGYAVPDDRPGGDASERGQRPGGGRPHGGGGHRGGRGGGPEGSGGGRPSGGRGGGAGSGLTGAAPYGLLGDAQPVRSADADQSQSVSAAEFQAAAKRRFARLDLNGDGFLTFAELPLTPVQGRPGR